MHIFVPFWNLYIYWRKIPFVHDVTVLYFWSCFHRIKQMRIVRWSNSESIYALDFRCNILPLRNTVCILLDECEGMGSVDWHTVYIITVCQNNISNRALLASCGKINTHRASITNWGKIITNRGSYYKFGQNYYISEQALQIEAIIMNWCRTLHTL